MRAWLSSTGTREERRVPARPDEPSVVSEIGRLLRQQLADRAHRAPENAGFDAPGVCWRPSAAGG